MRPRLSLASFAVLVCAIGLSVVGCGTPPAGRTSAALAVEPAANEAPPGREIRIERVTLGRGGTLDEALRRLGVPDDRHRDWLDLLGRHVDVRRLRPETGLTARIDEDGEVLGVAVRDRTDRWVRIRTDEDAVRVETLPVPLRLETRVDHGTIEHSVAQAFSHLPEPVAATAAFADVMQWDVDLYIDPRPGDRVRMAYETYTLGDVPPDLPTFGPREDSPGSFVKLGRVLAARYDGAMASAEGFFVADGNGGGDFYDRDGNPLRKSFLKSPLNYRRISSRFSRNRLHPVTKKVSPHHGVDFAAAPGTPVVATADGRVTAAGWDGPLGRAVRVRHNGEYTTVYGHFRAIARGVRRGATVKQNQVIGYVGSTGRATGPHLHYTVLRNGRPIDPLRMKNPPREPLAPELRPWLEIVADRWGPRMLESDADAVRSRQVAGADASDGRSSSKS